jgi:hypothetical protein
MAIMLNEILSIPDPREYKLHLACRSPEGTHPLDEYVADAANWLHWNEWRGAKNDWNRPYVLSFMEFYPEPDAWLFGGEFEVLARKKDGYKLCLVDGSQKFVGRLVARFHRYQGMRGRAYRLESFLEQFEVHQILPIPYQGEAFCGIVNIDHDFGTLEAVFRNQRPDWRAALSDVKGVYLISDKSNGKKYVGSAYGDAGIWSRWACYMGTGHGGNDDLVRLIKSRGMKYARENFHFAILEVMAKSTPDEVVTTREAHWKRVLLSREHGYNKN